MCSCRKVTVFFFCVRVYLAISHKLPSRQRSHFATQYNFASCKVLRQLVQISPA